MRPDVKLGVVISMVVVLVAGGYYLYRDRSETPIPLASADKVGIDSNVPADRTTTATKPTGRDARRPAARNRGKQAVRTGTERNTPRAAARRPASAESPTVRQPKPRPSKRADASDPSQSAPAKLAEGRKRHTQLRPEAFADRKTTANRRTNAPETALPADTKSGDTETGAASPARTKVATRDRPRSATPTRAGQAAKNPTRRPVPLVGKRNNGPQPAARRTAKRDQSAVETHRVLPGDTMSSLAQQYYGSTKYTQFLIDGNPHIRNPNRLTVGMTVKIPEKPPEGSIDKASQSSAAGNARSGVNRQTYTVKTGDTFYGIAQDQLGDASRWQEIFDLNKDVVHGDPKRLQVGHVLVLPD